MPVVLRQLGGSCNLLSCEACSDHLGCLLTPDVVKQTICEQWDRAEGKVPNIEGRLRCILHAVRAGEQHTSNGLVFRVMGPAQPNLASPSKSCMTLCGMLDDYMHVLACTSRDPAAHLRVPLVHGACMAALACTFTIAAMAHCLQCRPCIATAVPICTAAASTFHVHLHVD